MLIAFGEVPSVRLWPPASWPLQATFDFESMLAWIGASRREYADDRQFDEVVDQGGEA